MSFVTSRSPRHPGGDRRTAFSITELLVVIGIIVLLVALLLPALAAAQRRARTTATSATMDQFRLACESFHQKFGFYPGVVPEAVLAADPKISGTENALLHLMGGYIRQEDDAAIWNLPEYSGSDWQTITFGSGQNAYSIRVNRFRIGEGPRIGGQSYPPFFSPKGSELRALPGQSLSNIENPDPYGDDPYRLPDLVDAWGQPIIYVRSLRDSGPLVGAPNVAQFSRATTAPYLSSVALGDLGQNQSDSILNQGNADNRDGNFAQIIRHPGFGAANQPQGGAPPQGRFVILSAGKDGVFFSRFDGPGKPSAPVTNIITTGPKVVEEYDDIRRFGGS
ncbi:MAG TPA: hypothetical protein PKC43_10500 [Phycisphaerales bacterium]|nr:hypothetical protein [Phycisphaerales bacterium]HMP37865.1 hypothetical protein [Phycisphaerales bacterium]